MNDILLVFWRFSNSGKCLATETGQVPVSDLR